MFINWNVSNILLREIIMNREWKWDASHLEGKDNDDAKVQILDNVLLLITAAWLFTLN